MTIQSNNTNTEMKEMKYLYFPTPAEVLYVGKYKGYDCVIISLGTHPCAYVRIPKNHPLFGKDYMKCSFPEGYRVTFSGPSITMAEGVSKQIPEGYYLGWDYLLGPTGELCPLPDGEILTSLLYKYTTDEIYDDCKDFVDYLIEMC